MNRPKVGDVPKKIELFSHHRKARSLLQVEAGFANSVTSRQQVFDLRGGRERVRGGE